MSKVKTLEEAKTLLAELYQVLGVLDAPVEVLDQVTAFIQDEPLPHESLLPFDAPILGNPTDNNLKDGLREIREKHLYKMVERVDGATVKQVVFNVPEAVHQIQLDTYSLGQQDGKESVIDEIEIELGFLQGSGYPVYKFQQIISKLRTKK